MENTKMAKLNSLLRRCLEYGEKYKLLVGQGVSKVSDDFCTTFKTDIPAILEEWFPKDVYKIKSSIGAGRITQCPWIAIMNVKETTSTQQGVYLSLIHI